MTREEAKSMLVNVEPDFLEEAKMKVNGHKTWICPNCGNGSGGTGDGITLNPTSKGNLPHWKCFVCGLNADVIELYKICYDLHDYKSTFDEVYKYYGFTIDEPQSSPTRAQSGGQTVRRDNTPPPQTAPQNAAQSVTAAKDFSSYYAECSERLLKSPEALSYLEARGISTDTALQYGIGYDAYWRSPTALAHGKNPPTSPRLILPTSAAHYVARDIRPDAGGNFAKMNEGKPALFNAAELCDNPPEAVFVTEGYFDALSIIEAGAAAIALNSTSNASKLLDLLAAYRPNTTLILCLDNDDAGRKASQELEAGLRRLNISYVTADITNGHKDPNEALQADREGFKKAITAAVKQTAARPDAVNAYIDAIMSDEILQFREANNRKTGFANLDEKAKGLYAGLYVVAAISSLGKTTFCHQMADQLAEAGEDVLFFSLEQSRLELVSKSISRMAARNDINTAVSSLSIRRGYLPEPILKAAQEYKNKVADRLSVIEGNFSCDISFIGDYIRRYIQRTGTKPVIFVDYLQILQPGKDDRGRTQSTKETVDTTVTELKRISREHGLTVFVISSVNRTNYMTPIAFESLKESGGIEYTADCIYGLQLQCMNDSLFDKGEAIKEKRQRIKEAKAASPRKIELVCLKNRYGVSSFSCFFDYIPEFDLFTEGTAPASTEPPKAGRKLSELCKEALR